MTRKHRFLAVGCRHRQRDLLEAQLGSSLAQVVRRRSPRLAGAGAEPVVRPVSDEQSLDGYFRRDRTPRALQVRSSCAGPTTRRLLATRPDSPGTPSPLVGSGSHRWPWRFACPHPAPLSPPIAARSIRATGSQAKLGRGLVVAHMCEAQTAAPHPMRSCRG